jgi:coenzyme F420-0:L-glutamate ligase/coenzyme F420-1:gamma-L-glutamate ligase
MAVTIIPVTGIGEVQPGDDVATLIDEAVRAAGIDLVDGDVVVVTHKIVSKAEGQVIQLEHDGPDAHRHLIEQEAAAVIRRRGDLVIAVTRHGYICANAGVDRSNAGPEKAILLPRDPDHSANRIRLRLARSHDVQIAVIVTDTFGRAWRRGLVDVAIGVAGMAAITDLRGTLDDHGHQLEVTEVALADEIAAAADLAIGKTSRNPVAIVRGVEWSPADTGVSPLLRPAQEDLFR